MKTIDSSALEKESIIAVGSTAEIYSWAKNKVLKLFFKDVSLQWIRTERRKAHALYKAGFPVPAVGPIVKIGDRIGISYERIDGRNMFEILQSRPWRTFRYFRMMGALHAQIHQMHLPMNLGLPSQKWQLRHEIMRAKISKSTRKFALSALNKLPSGKALCHGDFHIFNVLVSKRGLNIVDWESASKGNPAGDVAQTILMTKFGDANFPIIKQIFVEILRTIFIPFYLWGYRARRELDDAQIDRWLLPLAAARLLFPVSKREASNLTKFIEKRMLAANAETGK